MDPAKPITKTIASTASDRAPLNLKFNLLYLVEIVDYVVKVVYSNFSVAI
mgnify:CR=1 FL=1